MSISHGPTSASELSRLIVNENPRTIQVGQRLIAIGEMKTL